MRQRVRQAVQNIPQAQRDSLSAQARIRLEQQSAWKAARTILFYAPLAEELDIWPCLANSLLAGKQAYLPRLDPLENTYFAHCVTEPEKDLAIAQFGIREPGAHCPQLPLNQLDFVLVPGVAFDPHGRRLGRGRGYYDRILAAVRGQTCGVAFDEQIVDEIPVEPHDVTVNCILTPSRWAKP